MSSCVHKGRSQTSNLGQCFHWPFIRRPFSCHLRFNVANHFPLFRLLFLTFVLLSRHQALEPVRASGVDDEQAAAISSTEIRLLTRSRCYGLAQRPFAPRKVTSPLTGPLVLEITFGLSPFELSIRLWRFFFFNLQPLSTYLPELFTESDEQGLTTADQGLLLGEEGHIGR